MIRYLCLGFSLLSLGAFAQDRTKHIVSFGTDGFGWSGFSQVFDWDNEKSGIKNQTHTESQLKLNYHYVFENRVMLGGEISSEVSESEVKSNSGAKTSEESSEAQYGISVGYNFNEDVFRSWWIAGLLGSGSYESVEKDSSGKTEFEFDYTYWQISAGKRFSLESWGAKLISYNPSVSLVSAKVSGDAEDAGLETMSQFKIEFLKIDILF